MYHVGLVYTLYAFKILSLLFILRWLDRIYLVVTTEAGLQTLYFPTLKLIIDCANTQKSMKQSHGKS